MSTTAELRSGVVNFFHFASYRTWPNGSVHHRMLRSTSIPMSGQFLLSFTSRYARQQYLHVFQLSQTGRFLPGNMHSLLSAMESCHVVRGVMYCFHFAVSCQGEFACTSLVYSRLDRFTGKGMLSVLSLL